SGRGHPDFFLFLKEALTVYKKHYDVNTQLMRVAQGEEKAETAIQNGSLVNVLTGELLDNQDVALAHGRIAFVGGARHAIGPETDSIDATGKYIAPGCMDAHMHVERTMLSVTEFAKAALVKGTTSIFMEPHEISNVFGRKG